MARPKKDNAEYFSHDKSMRNDPKIRALRKNFGLKGYAIYCMILESLTDCSFFELKYDDLQKELMCGDFDCQKDELEAYVDYMVIVGLITVEGGFLSCKTLINRFESLLSRRKREQNGVIVADNAAKRNNNPQSTVKYSKVDNKKEEKKHTQESVRVLTPINCIENEYYEEFKRIYSAQGQPNKIECQLFFERVGRDDQDLASEIILRVIEYNEYMKALHGDQWQFSRFLSQAINWLENERWKIDWKTKKEVLKKKKETEAEKMERIGAELQKEWDEANQ